MCMEFIAYSNKIISIKVALFDKFARCLHCSYCVPKTIVKSSFLHYNKKIRIKLIQYNNENTI